MRPKNPREIEPHLTVYATGRRAIGLFTSSIVLKSELPGPFSLRKIPPPSPYVLARTVHGEAGVVYKLQGEGKGRSGTFQELGRLVVVSMDLIKSTQNNEAVLKSGYQTVVDMENLESIGHKDLMKRVISIAIFNAANGIEPPLSASAAKVSRFAELNSVDASAANHQQVQNNPASAAPETTYGKL